MLPEWYFLQAIRGLQELSRNSSSISGDSGDSGEMGEAGAPRTLPSTRAWGQDDSSSHKLPQIRARGATDRNFNKTQKIVKMVLGHPPESMVKKLSFDGSGPP